jgi:hypothetical protein
MWWVIWLISYSLAVTNSLREKKLDAGVTALPGTAKSRGIQTLDQEQVTMTRRTFGNRISAALAGVGAAALVRSSAQAADKKEKHVCKGMNECKGQGGCKSGEGGAPGKNSCKGKGGCATVAKHECKGHNECKGQGGCASGEGGAPGKNSCKGKGGCQVPLKAKQSLRRRRSMGQEA